MQKEAKINRYIVGFSGKGDECTRHNDSLRRKVMQWEIHLKNNNKLYMERKYS